MDERSAEHCRTVDDSQDRARSVDFLFCGVAVPTLLKLLKAAGFDLRMHLEPYDDHDDVLDARERSRTHAEQDEWDERQRARLAAVGGRRKSKATRRR